MSERTFKVRVDGQEKTIRAEVADDATPEEISATINGFYGKKEQIDYNQVEADQLQNQKERQGAGYGLFPEPIARGIDKLRKLGNKVQTGQSEVKQPTLLDNIIEGVRPFLNIPAIRAGTIAAEVAPVSGLPPSLQLPARAAAGAAVAAGTYFTVDKALQASMNEPPVMDTATNLLVTEIGGKIVTGGIGAGKAWVKSISDSEAVLGAIARLKPRLYQYLEAATGKKAGVAKLFSDFFDDAGSVVARERSATLGKTEGDKLVQQLTGRQGKLDIGLLGNHIKIGSLTNALKAFYKESNTQYGIVGDIAKGETKTLTREVPSIDSVISEVAADSGESLQNVSVLKRVLEADAAKGVSLADSLKGIASSPANSMFGPIAGSVSKIAESLSQGLKNVEGPIYLNKSLPSLNKFLSEYISPGGEINWNMVPNEHKLLVNKAQQILSLANPVFDNAGNLVKSDPIPFKAAWSFKKLAGSGANFRTQESGGPVTDKAHFYSEEFATLSDDIENSIGQWGSDPGKTVGKQALEAWRNGNATVSSRINFFKEFGLGDMIKASTSPNPFIDKVIGDVPTLEKALKLGYIKFPSGNIYATNIRRDLQGYQMTRFLNDAWTTDAMQKEVFNFDKLKANLHDSNLQENWDVLFGVAKKKQLMDFFQDLATTQQNKVNFGPYTSIIMPAKAGISVAASLLMGRITGPGLAYSAPVASIFLGGPAIARLMNGEGSSRVLAALAKGRKSTSDAYISRMIVDTLTGTGNVIGLQHSGGVTTWGTLEHGQDGPVFTQVKSPKNP
jgi:hypothetical protein